MEIPFEIFIGLFATMVSLSVIGIWKQIPLMMFVGGALITFVIILTDSMPALGDSQTCTTAIATTTCTQEPYILDPWIKIIFAIFGSLFMIGGALIWKAMED